MKTIQNRKRKHIQIVEKQEVEPLLSSFDKYRLPYSATPEIDLKEIDINTKFFDFQISAPLLISSMSGGEKYGKKLNENIARACEETRIPFGLGSTRILLEKPEVLPSFNVKKFCPNAPMFANIGLVQLNYGIGYDQIMHVVDLLNADGIFFHINHLQEAIQPEGDTNFKKLFEKFATLFGKLKIPVAVKETGHGIDFESAKRFAQLGVKWIDVSGTGGTSWALVEGYRRLEINQKMSESNLGYIMRNEGVSTDQAIIDASSIPNLNIIAGGGIRNGLHIVKAIALGAKLATSAKPFMHAALESEVAVINLINRFKSEIRVGMFISGASNIKKLSEIKLIKL